MGDYLHRGVAGCTRAPAAVAAATDRPACSCPLLDFRSAACAFDRPQRPAAWPSCTGYVSGCRNNGAEEPIRGYWAFESGRRYHQCTGALSLLG